MLNELIADSTIADDIVTNLKDAELQRLPLNDRITLSTAIGHGADAFVTGNHKDFKRLYHKKVLNTLILRPLDFLNREF
ncbi:MAG: hypothetical protein AB1805_02915 [Nitrospirota bacterium]